jgi:flagellar biosynthetic protein FliR
VLVGAEALIGLTMGLGVLLLFSSMHVAGQVISQMSGLQLADVFNPGFDTNVPVVSQLLFYVATAVFVIIGGHRRVMEALLDTFVWLPAGQGGMSRSVVEATTSLLAESFVLGIRGAAPAMVALLLATLILGLVSRTLPQLNVMALGFGFGALVTMATLSVSMGAAAWIFQSQLDPFLQTVLAALKTR